jgi:hypothetical protein
MRGTTARWKGRLNPGHISPARWYVRRALEARRLLGAFAVAGLIPMAGCGGGERQDAHEPSGNFPVEVVHASFPKKQALALESSLVISLRNAGSDTIPNIAVTVNGFDYRSSQPDLADSERPQFAVNGVPREIGGFPEAKDSTPPGCETAYVNTWACGPLKAGKERTFRWSVTPVKAGPYEVKWVVAAGLNGKAKAVSSGGGGAPTGSFSGTVSAAIPKARVADDGKTVVIESP